MDADLEILRQLRAGVDQYKIIQIRQAKFKMRPLAIDEQGSITSEVVQIMQSAEPHMSHKINEEITMAKKVLQAASTSDLGKQDPKLPEALLGKMTSGEIMAIYNEYMKWTDQINPNIENMTKDEILNLVESLKKNSSQTKDLSHGQREILLNHFLTSDG